MTMEWICLTCKHYTPEHGLTCVAFPDGIPIEVASGQLWHDHLFGDEKEPVFYEPKEETTND